MISKLSIQNYAIINQLSVDFKEGFTVITGETGAGKSIILGALSLILGQRVDTSVLKNAGKKCIVEGQFDLRKRGDLISVFDENDVYFEDYTYIRREITASGKSRAFVNDTPVNLKSLREIALNLIDLHSQHANLELSSKLFQLNVIDWYGGMDKVLADYRKEFIKYGEIRYRLETLKVEAAKAKSDLDYFEFQFQQLEEANLKEEEQEELEKEQEQLNHTEEIISGLSGICNNIVGEDDSVISKLKSSLAFAESIHYYLPDSSDYAQRIKSAIIDLSDIADESERLLETTAFDPNRLDFITERLDVIYTLQQKHQVNCVEELLAIKNDLDVKIKRISVDEEEISFLEKDLFEQEQKLNIMAQELTRKRMGLFERFTTELLGYLKNLGMPNAQFFIKNEKLKSFTINGVDEIHFMFSAHKGGEPMDVIRVASGGELSRLMLGIKVIIGRSKALPTIIFDEIDTGISGDIAGKMAEILKKMAANLQIINITHLPQIAAKGDQHYQVFKEEGAEVTETGMRLLSIDDRKIEIAKMLSGAEITPEALQNAESLMK